MRKTKELDYLNGSLWDKILLFAIPVAVSGMLQQLFNAADLAVIGKYCGSVELAAVGSNSAMISLIVSLFTGLSVGTNVVLAKYIGQKEENKIKQVVHTSIIIAIVSGLLLIVLGMIFAKRLLVLMLTPENILSLAALYLRIYFLGMPFMMLYNFGAAILRAVGETNKTLVCLFVSGIVNVILNVFFVVCFHMSVSGVALATMLAKGVSATIVIYFLVRHTGAIKLNLKQLKYTKEVGSEIIKIGLPAGLQGMVFSISNVIIQTSINSFGSDIIAGSTAGANFEYITSYVIQAFGQATVTFVGQNYGAKNLERCKRIVMISCAMAVGGTMLVSGIFLLFKTQFLHLFTSEQVVVEYGSIRMMTVLAFIWLNAIVENFASGLRAMGYSTLPAIITVVGVCGIRIVLIATLFKTYSTYNFLLKVYPISWVITAIVMVITYFIMYKKVVLKMKKD